MSDETIDLINRFKAYLAHDQYNRDKRTMMDGLGEERIDYRLPIATLINLNQPIVKAQLAEVA